jgi:hypothetical protein
VTKVASKPDKVASATYHLRINEAQVRAISHACEVLARLGMGQFKDALECLPLKEYAPDGWWEDMEGIAHILKKHTTIMHGVGSYHGISSAKTSPESKTAWDVHQVIRHQLAWDAAQENGHPGEGEAMRPSWSVVYDQPMKTSAEPLAWIEKDAG